MMRQIVLSAVLATGHCTFSTAADTLLTDAKLTAGENLASADGNYVLVMQSDGNLVMYHGTTALWSSGTSVTSGAECRMQGDGNLVVYGMVEGKFTAVWASCTDKPGARLDLQNDGNVVIYHDRVALWSSESHQRGQAILKTTRGFLEFGHVRYPQVMGHRTKADTKPKPKIPESLVKLEVAKHVSTWASNKLGYGKWLARVAGRVVPVVGWVIVGSECALCLCDSGEWVYGELFEVEGEPNPNAGKVSVAVKTAGEMEAITPLLSDDGTCSLLFHTGFLHADADVVIANRAKIEDAEKFRITRHDDGTVSLLAVATGKYLSASEAGLKADAETLDASAKFTPEAFESSLFLKLADGGYVSALPRRTLSVKVKENVAAAAQWVGTNAADAGIWVGDKASDAGGWIGDKSSDSATWSWGKMKGGYRFFRRQLD